MYVMFIEYKIRRIVYRKKYEMKIYMFIAIPYWSDILSSKDPQNIIELSKYSARTFLEQNEREKVS